MSTYLMTQQQPFAAHLSALDLNPDLLSLVDDALDLETEASVRAAVAAHWMMQDRTYVRYIRELVQDIRQTNDMLRIEDDRSDERIIAMLLKKADLLDRPAPLNWLAHSKAMVALFRMYVRTSRLISKITSIFLWTFRTRLHTGLYHTRPLGASKNVLQFSSGRTCFQRSRRNVQVAIYIS